MMVALSSCPFDDKPLGYSHKNDRSRLVRFSVLCSKRTGIIPVRLIELNCQAHQDGKEDQKISLAHSAFLVVHK